MAITYYMLQIPSWLLFFLMITAGALFAGLTTFLCRRYIKVIVLRAHNEVMGFLFLAIASFYALLLSFVMLVVWGQMNESRNNVSKEGSSAMGMYRDIKFYPDAVESKELLAVYLDYVFNVVDEEFPNMEHMKLSRKTPEALNKVFYKMEHLNPKNPYQIQLVGEMYRHLNELATYRGLRNSSMETEIPSPIWMPLLGGALITIVCAVFMDVEHSRVHIILNSLLGIFIGMFFFIIILLDHPYTGRLALKPKAYKQIFTLEQWANELHLKLNNK